MKPTIITKELAVGRFSDAEQMKKDGWKVICLASGEDVPEFDCNVELVDGSGNSKEQIKAAILNVVGCWNNDEKTFVCCRMGMSRSPSVAAAALAVAAKVEWISDGLLLIGGKRPIAHPRDDTLAEVLEVLMEIREVKEARAG